MSDPPVPVHGQLPEPMLLVDPGGTILWANEAAHDRLGTDGATKLDEVFADKDQARAFVRRSRGSTDPIVSGLDTHCGVQARWQGWLAGGPDENPDRLVVLRALEGATSLKRFQALSQRIGSLNEELAKRRRAEKELESAHRFLDNILASSTEYAIVAQDREGHIESWNEGARRLFDREAEEVRGEHRSILFDEIEHARLDALHEEAVAKGAAEARLHGLESDGTPFRANVVVTPRTDANGTHQGYLAIIRDITIEERMERVQEENRTIRQVSRHKSDFLANMSHELRTPLNSIIGFAELMKTDRFGHTPSHHQEFLEDILTSAKHLLRLINDVLDLSKVEEGRLVFHPETFYVEETIQQTLDSLRPQLQGRDLTVQLDLEGGPDQVTLDPGRFRQVLLNYLNNAIKFSPKGGTITVRSLTPGPDRIRVEVSDEGPGFEADEAELIFQPFERLDSTARINQEGAGLGLALTRELVEAQGGAVGAEGAPGEGATFHAEFPTHFDGEGPTTRRLPSRGRDRGRSRVLVVEDDTGQRAALVNGLRGTQLAVEAAATLEEARQRVDQRRYQALILAARIEGRSAQELVQALRADGPNQGTPILVIALPSERVPFATEVEAYLRRPVSPSDVQTALERIGIAPGRGRPVLVVEDDPRMLRVLELEVGHLGHTLMAASNAAEAVDALRAVLPSVLVLDLTLPDATGQEVLDALRSVPGGPEVPVVVWTGRDRQDERVRALETEPNVRVLQKGQEGTEPLVATLRQLLGAPGEAWPEVRP